MQSAEAIRRKAIEEFAKEGEGGSDTPLYQQRKVQATKAFADIPQLFQPFTELPQPSSFDPMINAMRPAVEKVSTGEVADKPVERGSYAANPNLTKVPGVSDPIDDWSGDAARDFKRGFVDPFPAVLKNQFIVARVAQAALESEKEMWTRARRDIDDIARKTLAALDNMHGCGKNEWKFGFAVAGALAALAAAFVSGGAAVPLGIAEFGAVTAGATADLTGETTAVVINSMRRSIAQLTREINETENVIWKAADSTRDAIQRKRSWYVSKRPDLANATAANVKSSKYMGYAL
jgi:hypothetical protein